MFWFSLQLQNLSETFLIIRRTDRDVIKKYIGLQVNSQLLVSDVKEISLFSTDFSKNTQIWYFTKIISDGTELFHADGRVDMTMLIVVFQKFTNKPKH